MSRYDVIVIGAGPAGIFTALELLKEKPETKLLILEKGRIIENRRCPKRKTINCVNCAPCSITSGWGGAGAFSDGKLSLSPEVGGEVLTEFYGEDKVTELINYVDGIYLGYGGSEKVYYDSEFADQVSYKAKCYGLNLVRCPVRHLGTEDSARIMDEMYKTIKEYPNVDIRDMTPVNHVLFDETTMQVTGAETKDEKFYADHVVVSVGRNGADWFHKECKNLGIQTTSNQVDIGVRVEVPRCVTDKITDRLYEFKFLYYSDTFENKVRTFCMNPGGFVAQENYDDGLAVVNGHCYSNVKSENTNFALLVSSRFTDPFDDPIKYGKYIAQLGNMLTGGSIMVQRLEDLKMGRRTDVDRMKKLALKPTLKDAVPGDLSYVLPHRHLVPIMETLKALDNICPGMYGKNTLLYGVEVKFYSSRVQVNPQLETAIKGLYAIGDGAGITRGLMQASVTGVLAARDIINKIG
jgi:hypothetical protein